MKREYEDQLLEEWRQTGDMKVLEPIFEYLHKIFTFYVGKYKNPLGLDRDDMVQELQIGALKALKTYTPGKARFTSYVASDTSLWRRFKRLENKEKKSWAHRLGDSFIDNMPSDPINPLELVELYDKMNNIQANMKDRNILIILRELLDHHCDVALPSSSCLSKIKAQLNDKFKEF